LQVIGLNDAADVNNAAVLKYVGRCVLQGSAGYEQIYGDFTIEHLKVTVFYLQSSVPHHFSFRTSPSEVSSIARSNTLLSTLERWRDKCNWFYYGST
jgi:hypothetical protein